jgi:hypothetical protein
MPMSVFTSTPRRLLSWAITAFVAALLTIACTHAQNAATARDEISFRAQFENLSWQPKYRGVDYASLIVSEPRRMALHILRIDTHAEGIVFFSTPGAPRPRSAGEETLGVRTSSFLVQHKLQAAINAAPYGPQYEIEGMPYNVAGLHIHKGELISPQTKSYPSLLIDKNNRIRIATPPVSISDAQTAVGGFNVLLRNGDVIPKTEGGIHPRTAVGVSSNKRWVWWLVIDGRQLGHSDGASLIELAQIFRDLGASDAINLDGGGTSTLVIEDKAKRFRILNRPIHQGIVGNERVAGSHLGLFAAPLEK